MNDKLKQEIEAKAILHAKEQCGDPGTFTSGLQTNMYRSCISDYTAGDSEYAAECERLREEIKAYLGLPKALLFLHEKTERFKKALEEIKNCCDDEEYPSLQSHIKQTAAEALKQ